MHPGRIKTNVARNAKFIRSMDEQGDALMLADQFDKEARTTPEQAAAVIVRGMEQGSHRVLIGADARRIDWVTRLFPVSYFRRLGALPGGR